MNQIEATIAKAALGAGWPHGLAEDCGRATAWLVARGFDGVRSALAAISPGPSLPVIEEAKGITVFRATQAIRAAPSAFDVLAAGGCRQQVLLQEIDRPLMVVGFGGIAATTYGVAFRLAFENACEVIVDRSLVQITGTFPSSGAEAIMDIETSKPAEVTAMLADLEIDDHLWRDALTMAAKSYVPSNNTSRQFGAGAGLIDDD